MYDRVNGVLDEPIGEGMHVRVPWFQVRSGRAGAQEGSSSRSTGSKQVGSQPATLKLLLPLSPSPLAAADPQRHGHPHAAPLHLLGHWYQG